MNPAVVIPTYDRADMVVDAVESALAQSRACSVVVVDDGSTDDTLERLEAYGDRIRVLARENRERGAARNAGAEAVPDADPLFFVDADDVLGPGHVEGLCRLAADHPGAPVVAAPALLVDEELAPLGRLGHARPGPVPLLSFLLARQTLPPSAVGVRRADFDAVGGFHERRDLAGSEDWLLAARLLARGDGVRGEEPTVLLRRHEANTMQDAASMQESMLLAHRLLFDECWSPPPDGAPVRALPDDIRDRSEARLLLNAATQHYAAGDMSRARRVLARAARTDPGVVLEPKWGWTGLRTLLGRRLSAGLRRVRRGVEARRR